jgi:hypothetical protein
VLQFCRNRAYRARRQIQRRQSRLKVVGSNAIHNHTTAVAANTARSKAIAIRIAVPLLLLSLLLDFEVGKHLRQSVRVHFFKLILFMLRLLLPLLEFPLITNAVVVGGGGAVTSAVAN